MIHLRIATFLTLWISSTMHAADDPRPDTMHATEPQIHPTWLWFATQLVPSPQWSLLEHGGSRFGLRWQATPVLYSFGINRKLSPWRWFIVEPFIRQSGSIELFCSPEYANLGDAGQTPWMFRSGFRGYIPLWQHGEYLSASGAASYAMAGGTRGMSYEAGLYGFAGIVGLQVTYTPVFTSAPWIFTIRLRYF